MKYAIDETELARLERLKEDSDNSRKIYGGDTPATVWYQLEAANAVPALVAEVRRLRHFKDAAEFEATVSAKLTCLDAEDLPCANSMSIFCPRPPFRGRNCGPWCLLRMARLDAEEEIGKHADRE